MADEKKCVDAEEVARDWGISKSMAYKIIQKLNNQISEKYPDAIIVSGKVSRGMDVLIIAIILWLFLGIAFILGGM